MFVFDRSATAVLVPIALLVAVVLWSGRSATPDPSAARVESATLATTVAQVESRQAQGS